MSAKTIAYAPIAARTGARVTADQVGGFQGLRPDLVKSLCREHGAVMLSGFNPDMRAFEKLTDAYCAKHMGYEGGAHERKVLNPDGDGTIYSVNFYFGRDKQYTFTLPLHADMSYIRHSPTVLWLYCIQPASDGGDTMICDGAQAYDALSEPTRRLFQEHPITYIRRYPDKNWQVRFGTSNMDEVRAFCSDNGLELTVDAAKNELTTRYTVSAVPHSRWLDRPVFRNSILPVLATEEAMGNDFSIVRLDGGRKFPPELIKELREVTDRVRVLVRMVAGDILLLDNTRVLHGRMKFGDPNREVAIRMAREIDW